MTQLIGVPRKKIVINFITILTIKNIKIPKTPQINHRTSLHEIDLYKYIKSKKNL